MQPSPRVPVSRCIESQPESYFHGDASIGKTSSSLSSLLLEGKHSVGYVCIVGGVSEKQKLSVQQHSAWYK